MKACTQIACGVLLAAAAVAAPRMSRQPITTAYHDAETITVVAQPVGKGQRAMDFGPWQLGVAARGEHPRDRRLNLYVVVPGQQHHVDGWEEYDHNVILNAVPEDEEAREWDVYWVLVLDPQLRQDLRTERDVLVRAQERFLPSDLFEYDDIPADTVLRQYLHIDSVEGLATFRHKDGTLPRLLVLPADSVVHMSIRQPAAAAAAK